MGEVSRGDRSYLSGTKRPGEMYASASRRKFLWWLAAGGATALATSSRVPLLEWISQLFANKNASPLPPTVAPGEPEVKVVIDGISRISEQVASRNLLAELTSKNKPSRFDLLKVLNLDSDPITKYANDTTQYNSHIFSPIASNETFIQKIANEIDPVRKTLMAIAYSGMEGNYDPNELSPFIWANEHNRADSDGDGVGGVNKCNTYAQFIAQLVTSDRNTSGNVNLAIGHVINGDTPVVVTPETWNDVFGNPSNLSQSARDITTWLGSEFGGKNREWGQVTKPEELNRSNLSNTLLYVACFDPENIEDGHNFIVFFDNAGNRYTTQSTYNVLLEPLSDEVWEKIFTKSEDNEYHVFSHKIVP